MVLWDKNRAQVNRKACALVVSASLALISLFPSSPASAQDAGTTTPGGAVKGAPGGAVGPPPGGAGAPAPNLPSVTNPPIVTPPVATPPVAPPPGNPTPAAPPVITGPGLNQPPLNLPGAATGDGTAPGAPQLTGRVSRITIIGNANINGDAIRAVITQAGLRLGDAYTAGLADAARDAVKGMGYFNGDVGIAAEPDPAGGVDVAFTVKENPVVKTIKFTANTPTGEPTIPAATLKSKMTTQEGKVLNTNVLVRDLDGLFNHQTGYVRSQGYIFDVSSDINIDPLTGVLTIPLVEAHINSITVKGNKRTKTQVVTRELRSQVGDVLDEHKLQRDLTRVYNLGLFDEVGPFDENSTDVGKVDILVPVAEKRSGQVSVGVGYSSTSKLVGRAELAENNFRGLGERVSLQWEVGGINSQSSLELGFFEPYLDKKHTSLDVDVYDKAVYRFNSGQFQSGTNVTGNDNTYLERRKGGVVGVNRSINDYLTAGLTLRGEDVSTDNVTLLTQDQFIRQNGTVFGLGGRAIFSNRDNENAPAAGGFRSFSYEVVTARTRPSDSQAISPLPPGAREFRQAGPGPAAVYQPGRAAQARQLQPAQARSGDAPADRSHRQEHPVLRAVFHRRRGLAARVRHRPVLGQQSGARPGGTAPALQQKGQQLPGRPAVRRRGRLGQHLSAARSSSAQCVPASGGLWHRNPSCHPNRPDPPGLRDPDDRFARRADTVQHRPIVLI